MAYCRMAHQSPLSRMDLHIAKSFLSVSDTKKYSVKDFIKLLIEVKKVKLMKLGTKNQSSKEFKSYSKNLKYLFRKNLLGLGVKYLPKIIPQLLIKIGEVDFSFKKTSS